MAKTVTVEVLKATNSSFFDSHLIIPEIVEIFFDFLQIFSSKEKYANCS